MGVFDKPNRNDPCPCGSGKKYKKCCQGKTIEKQYPDTGIYSRQNDCNSILRYFQTHSTHEVLNFVIGLQMSPSNHGKNVRIEDLARLAVLSIHDDNSKSISFKELRTLLDRDYEYNCMEDLPCNMFSENVAYYGGAYTVFPGITSFSIEILNGLLQSIFQSQCGLSEDVKNQIHDGCQCLLSLGKFVSNSSGVEGNVKGGDSEVSNLDTLMCPLDYSVSKNEFKRYLSAFDVNSDIIDQFVLNVKDHGIISADPDLCPLLQKPIVEYNGRYYFLLISNQANAISSFIMRTLVENHFEDQIASVFHLNLWNQIREGCTLMGWPLTNIPLPDNPEPYIDEVVAQFDVNWYAYICYVHSLGENMKDTLDGGHWTLSLDEHINQAVDFIKHSINGKHVLTLILYSSMGENMMLLHDGADSEDYRLSFSAFDFIDLTKSENWNNLSLLRFAQAVKSYKGAFNPTQDSLDLYSIYKLYGESFYMTDKQPSSFVFIPPGDGRHLIFDAKLKRDFKLIPFEKRGEHFLLPVVSSINGMPIYEPSRSINGYYVVTIACEQPIWVFCEQVQTKFSYEYHIAELFGLSLVFWLTKMSKVISPLIRQQYKSAISVQLVFDTKLFDEHKYVDEAEGSPNEAFSVTRKDDIIQIYLHRSILFMVSGGTNYGERVLISGLLKELLSLKDVEVDSMLDAYMPLGSAKMIIISTSATNEMLDNRWLCPPIMLTKATEHVILDYMPKVMADNNCDIKGVISNEADKQQFLHDLVRFLLGRLSREALGLSKAVLLKRLVEVNESLLWQREQRAIRVPAKILCFGEDAYESRRHLEDDRTLTESSLAARCLAEYVVSIKDELEGVHAGADEIEFMMSLMRAVCTLGSQADALKLGLSDVSVEKLESGRYSISDDIFHDGISSFAEANLEEEMNVHISLFSRRLDGVKDGSANNSPRNKYAISSDDVNEAFKKDWGVSYADIDAFCFGCYNVCINYQTSALNIGADEFVKELSENQPNLSMEAISICLQHFALRPRANYLTAPEGYADHEVFPWVYNREFSYLRRFIMSYSNKGKEYYIMGPRSAMAALRQLATLLSNGRLKDETTALKGLRGKFNDLKGRVFNDKVRDYLKGSGKLLVFDYEVKISPNGHLKTDKKNYGDIDVLAFDRERKIVFSIECKDTEKARNVREMKTELDKYLGRPETGKVGYIEKHCNRHNWLMEHIEDVKSLIKEAGDIEIVSFVLTSEVIPLSYISKNPPALPIIAFSKLKSSGLGHMYETLGLDV